MVISNFLVKGSGSYELTPLASPQTHCLAILLKFGDQSVSMFHHVCILLVFIIRAVRFDDSIDTVNRAGNSVVRDKPSKVTVAVSLQSPYHVAPKRNSPIQKVHRNAEIPGHAIQTHHPVALEELLVSSEPHFTDEPGTMFV